MADISGVKITDLTACGASDDGEHIWITHRLGDGTEYPLIYPFESVGYLITVLTRSKNPTNLTMVKAASLGTGYGTARFP